MKTKVAIVGLGKMGLMHASVMGMLPDVELVALCEKNNLVRKFAKKAIPNIKLVSDIADFGTLGLDAICVTTPPSSHFSIIKSIYKKGLAKHIFTEKPLSSNYIQAQELCSLATKYGGVNMVGYHRRFSVTFRRAKLLLEADAVGKVSSFEGHAYSADFLGAKTTTQAIGRGGVLEDSGCHIIDMANWLLGELEVTSAKVTSLLGAGSEDEAFLTVKTRSGLKGELNASWCKEGYRLPDMRLVITGNNGRLSVNEDKVQLDSADGKSSIWYKHDLDDTVPFSIGGNEYQRQDDLFIKTSRNGGKVEPTFLTASIVEKAIDQAKEIIKGNKIK